MGKWSTLKTLNLSTKPSASEKGGTVPSAMIEPNPSQTRSAQKTLVQTTRPEEELPDDPERYEFGLSGPNGMTCPANFDRLPRVKSNAEKRNRNKYRLHPESDEYDDWRAEHPFKSWFGTSLSMPFDL